MSYNELQDGYTVDFDSDTDDTDDADLDIEAPSKNAKGSMTDVLFQYLRTTDILSPIAPDDSSQDRQDKKWALFASQKYLRKARNKQQATWEIFKETVRNPRLGLARNVYTQSIRFRNQEYSLEKLYKDLCETFKAIGHLPFKTFETFMKCELEWRTFNPVTTYLEATAKQHPEPWDGWNTLAETIFGTTEKDYQDMLTSFLIGSVKRAFEPGCIWRQCLVLQGTQEIGKTQFIRTLWGADYYASRDDGTNDTDVYRMLQRCWVMELEEMEAIASKRSVENLKRFISVQDDGWVIKYTEDAKKHPRKSVLVGTVNSTEFLRDDTGNSRYWVISIPGEINIPYVSKHRDIIWAEAVRRYKGGEVAWSKELSQKAQERAKEYQVTNVWTEPLEGLLDRLSHEFAETIRTPGEPPKKAPMDVAVTASGLLLALGVRTPDHAKHTAKLAKALEQLGYVKRKIRIGSKVYTRWAKPGIKPLVLEFDQQQYRWLRVSDQI